MSRKSGSSEEGSEESDSSDKESSNLLDALSATTALKKEVSIEVNEEIRREEKIKDVIDHSKEI